MNPVPDQYPWYYRGQRKDWKMKSGVMVRFLSLSAMTGAFLLISPSLRNDVAGGYNFAGLTLEQNSPYSYFLLAILAVFGLMILIRKSATPR